MAFELDLHVSGDDGEVTDDGPYDYFMVTPALSKCWSRGR